MKKDFIKNKKLILAGLGGILLLIIIGVLFFLTGRPESKIDNESGEAEKITAVQKAALSNAQITEIKSYIKQQSYDELTSYHDAYVSQQTVSQLLSEEQIQAVIDEINRFYAEYGVTTDVASIVRDAIVEVECTAELAEESRQYISNIITDSLADYIVALDINNINRQELNEEIAKATVDCINQYKNDLKFNATVVSSDSDILVQILRQIPSEGLPEEYVDEITGRLTAQMELKYNSFTLTGDEYLTEQRIANIVATISAGISEKVGNTLVKYANDLTELVNMINNTNNQYTTVQKQIEAVTSRIEVLQDKSDAASEDQLLKLQQELAGYNDQIAVLKASIDLISAKKTNISVFETAVNLTKEEFNTALVSTKENLSAVIDGLEAEINDKIDAGSDYTQEEVNAIRQNIADLSIADAELNDVLSNLSEDKLSLDKFEEYQKMVDNAIHSLDSNVSGNIESKITLLRESLAASDSKMEQYNKDLQNLVSDNKTEINQTIDTLQDSLSVTIANLENRVTVNENNITSLSDEVGVIKKSVSDGKSAVASAITVNGVSTPADATFGVLADNVNLLASSKYNAGKEYAYNDTTAITSKLYLAGVDKGIADADARVNESSASYLAGVADGKSASAMHSAVYSCAGDDDISYGYATIYASKIALQRRGHIYGYNADTDNEWCTEWYLGLSTNLKNVIPVIYSYSYSGDRRAVMGDYSYNASNGLLYMQIARSDLNDTETICDLKVRVYYSN